MESEHREQVRGETEEERGSKEARKTQQVDDQGQMGKDPREND